MKVLIAALAFSVGGAAMAGPAADEALGYEVVHIKIKGCRTKRELGMLRAETGQISAADAYREFLACKSGVTQDAKAVYAKVLKLLKSSDAKKALKDHQVAVMSSIEGMDPTGGELKSQYNRRVGSLDAVVETTWQRLQLEL